MNKNRIINIAVTELTTTEPVSLDEAKAQCRVDFTEDDTAIGLLITQCRKAVENFTHVSVISKRVIYTGLLWEEWELPYGPVIGIEAVETPQANPGSGPVPYEVASGGWAVDGEEFKTFAPAGAGFPFWDDHYSRMRNRLDNWTQRYRITYTVGYAVIPPDLKLAILNEIAYRYEHKGDEYEGVCEAAQSLSQPYLRTAWQ